MAASAVLIAIIVAAIIPKLPLNEPEAITRKTQDKTEKIPAEPQGDFEQIPGSETGENSNTPGVSKSENGVEGTNTPAHTTPTPTEPPDDKPELSPDVSIQSGSTEEQEDVVQQVNHTFSCFLEEEDNGTEFCSGVKIFIEGEEAIMLGRDPVEVLVPATTIRVRAELDGYKMYDALIDVNKREATQIILKK